jgi:protein SCO1/2|tara:strand:+ start:44 stop:694 length:651 start_codon:yes stop_codon:yes gene_type:complete
MTVKKNILAINILIIVLFISVVLTFFVKKITTPREYSKQQYLDNGLFLFDNPRQISDFSFYSANGKEFNKSDLYGKWTIMYFGFTRCPDECPTTMHEIKKLIKVLREKDFPLDDKQWVLVSIDPERDTPEGVDKYAKGYDEDFIGVSNNRPMLLSLATQLSVNNVMPSDDSMDHSHLDNHVNNIILLNPDGDFAGIFRPPFNTQRLSLTYQSITSS